MTQWEVSKNEEVRNLCTEDMDSTAKLLSLQGFPTFIEISISFQGWGECGEGR